MKSLFIINPRSGANRGQIISDEINNIITLRKIEGEIEILSRDRTHEILARAHNFDRLIIAGGDGTISSVINSLLMHECWSKIKDNAAWGIGIIPLGTGNDLARELNLNFLYQNHSLLEYLEKLCTNALIEYDAWQVRTEGCVSFFINYISIGFDGAVIETFHSIRPQKSSATNLIGKFLNRFLYGVAGLKNLDYSIDLKTVKISSRECEEIRLPPKAKSLIFTNISSIMGLGNSCLNSNPTDQSLEAGITTSLLNYLRFIFPKLSILPSITDLKGSKEWRISGFKNSVLGQIDGEPIKFGPAEIYISHGAKLRLVANKS